MQLTYFSFLCVIHLQSCDNSVFALSIWCIESSLALGSNITKPKKKNVKRIKGHEYFRKGTVYSHSNVNRTVNLAYKTLFTTINSNISSHQDCCKCNLDRGVYKNTFTSVFICTVQLFTAGKNE